MDYLRRAFAPVRNFFTNPQPAPTQSPTIRNARSPRGSRSPSKRQPTAQSTTTSKRRPKPQPGSASRILKGLIDRRTRLRKEDLWEIEELKRILKKRKDQFTMIESDFKRSHQLPDDRILRLLRQDGTWRKTQQDEYNETQELRNANLKFKNDIQKQDIDLRLYTKAIRDGLNEGQHYPKLSGLRKCEPSLKFLISCWKENANIREGNRRLQNLQERLRITKEGATRALQQAGLTHHETEVQQIEKRIKELKDAITKTRRRQVADLGAFFTAAGLDLEKMQTDDEIRSQFGNSKTKGTDEQIEKAQDDYHFRFNKMKESREEFEEYRDTYTEELQTTWETAIWDYPDKSQSQVEWEFTAQWLQRWRKMGLKLDKEERKFIGKQKQALGIGCQPVQIEGEIKRLIGSDIPQYFEGGHPEDGQVSTECSENKRALVEQAHRRRPRTANWLWKVEEIEDITPSEVEIKSISELEAGSMAPWESVSLMNRHPRRREMIDRYQIEMDEERYHRSII